jgi:hypothetical protein
MTTFTFGTNNATPAPTFGFNNQANSPAKPAAFTMGTGTTQSSTPNKPSAFSFTGNITQSSPANKPAAFSFGNNTQSSPANKPGAFSFGSGTPTQTASPSFSFGGASTTPTTSQQTFSFGGGSTSSGFSFGGNAAQASAAQDSSQVLARFNAVVSQIDGNDFDRFKFAFYNRGDQSKYRKPDKMSETMWKDAIARCPDNNSVPVLAHGFNALKARKDQQEKQRVGQEELINLIGYNIEEQVIKIQLLQDKFAESRKIVANNITRILNILSTAENLRRKGQPLNRNEERLFSQVEKMREELAKPGQYGSRVNELMSNVKSQSKDADNDYPSLDDETIIKVQDILSNFITALSSIMKDVNYNEKALNLIESSFHQSAIDSSK